MSDHIIVHVGSRKSELALIQTRFVITKLKNLYPKKEFKIVTMNTLGDQILDKPLPKIGEKSLFTKELELALAAKCVDFVVHSLKDLPTCLPEGMIIGAVLKRENPQDALVLRQDLKNHSLSTLPEGSIIGTSSLRRTAQLSRNYPHLIIEDIRGNLNTRLRKLDEMKSYSAVILAQAGLVRMGWNDRISQVLNRDDVMYAVGQGALAVECRDDDFETLEMLSCLHDPETVLEIIAERSFLKTLGGGCSAPVAVSTTIETNSDKNILKLEGAVWSLDGKLTIKDSCNCEVQILDSDANNEFKQTLIDLKSKTSDVTKNDEVNDDSSDDYEVASKKAKLCFENGDGIACLSSVNKYANITSCPYMKKNNMTNNECPISTLPIGVDFMGKCPYLDSSNDHSKCPINAKVIEENSNHEKTTLKCPIYNENFSECSKSKSDCVFRKRTSSKLPDYCGVIGCKFLSTDVLERVEKLGADLAKSIIGKGAQTILIEAQNSTHAAISVNK